MRFDKHILSVILLVAALLYTLSFVFAGFGNHQDPLYWLYKYEHLEGGWMAVGTLLTGGASFWGTTPAAATCRLGVCGSCYRDALLLSADERATT